MHAQLDVISRWEARGLLSRRSANLLRADALGIDAESVAVTAAWPCDEHGDDKPGKVTLLERAKAWATRVLWGSHV